jgi:hypothetical protein
MLLVERVSDDDVRVKVKSLMAAAPRIAFAKTRQESEQHLSKMTEEATRVLEGIGVVLRGYL